MTANQAIKEVLDLARSEIGYHEKASNSNLEDKTGNSGGANWTKYAALLDSSPDFYNGKKNGYAWCDVFVDYLFAKCFGFDKGREMLCQPKYSAGAGCLYSAQYYKDAGRFHKNAPMQGDQIFFSYSPGEYSHTGIVEEVNGDTVTTIEGNTSDSVGRRTYNIGSGVIAGYGTPRWNLVEDFVVVENGNIINSSEWSKDENTATAVLPLADEHKWIPKTLSYAPDDWYKDCETLQSLLNSHNFDSGKADGYFGSKTQAAVNRAKKFYGLPVDGICDEALWKKLSVWG